MIRKNEYMLITVENLLIFSEFEFHLGDVVSFFKEQFKHLTITSYEQKNQSFSPSTFPTVHLVTSGFLKFFPCSLMYRSGCSVQRQTFQKPFSEMIIQF